MNGMDSMSPIVPPSSIMPQDGNLWRLLCTCYILLHCHCERITHKHPQTLKPSQAPFSSLLWMVHDNSARGPTSSFIHYSLSTSVNQSTNLWWQAGTIHRLLCYTLDWFKHISKSKKETQTCETCHNQQWCLALATWVFVLLWTLLFACFSLDIPLVTRPPTLCKLWCAASMRLRICWNSFQSAATSQAKCARLNAVLPRLIHSTIAPVMCGTTCTVLPKYFPSRSCSQTSFYSRCTNTRANTLTYAWTILNIFADLRYETRSPS